MGTIAASDNEFPKVIFVEGAAPGTPPAGFVYVYAKADGRMYGKDDTGTEFAMNGATAEASIAAHLADTSDAHDASAVSVLDTGNHFAATDVEAALAELYAGISGGGIPATIIDAKGDLIGGTAADTAGRLAVGSNGSILMAASGETTGMKWHPFTSFDAPASADATITTANTYQDATGCSQSCAAGTWLFWWQMQFTVIVTTSQGYTFASKLWDGSSGIYGESEIDSPAAQNYNTFSWHTGGVALVTLGSTTTVKISGAVNRGSSSTKIARNMSSNSPTSNAATRLVGLRVG